ncbi:hypothetical protein B0A49_02502 [Cryomyces minteri]|uniref:Uncharacterized protein n=1 Tax=Cryomyces minteri TaxID=331657 RepID=A0A4U0XR29_9PEZI|nr:hypothetical protein B0A49_02502 [Cryomyces minteri]
MPNSLGENHEGTGGKRRSTADADDEIALSAKRSKTAATCQPLSGFTPINRPKRVPKDGPVDILWSTDLAEPAGHAGPAPEPLRKRNPLVAETLGLTGHPMAGPCSTPRDANVDEGPAKYPVDVFTCARSKKPSKASKTAPTRPVSAGLNTTNPGFIVNDLKLGLSPDCFAKTAERTLTTMRDSQAADDLQFRPKTLSKLDAFRFDPRASSSVAMGLIIQGRHRYVPVIAPVTSLDAVNAQSGYGCIVYKGSSQGQEISRRSQNTSPPKLVKGAGWSATKGNVNTAVGRFKISEISESKTPAVLEQPQKPDQPVPGQITFQTSSKMCAIPQELTKLPQAAQVQIEVYCSSPTTLRGSPGILPSTEAPTKSKGHEQTEYPCFDDASLDLKDEDLLSCDTTLLTRDSPTKAASVWQTVTPPNSELRFLDSCPASSAPPMQEKRAFTHDNDDWMLLDDDVEDEMMMLTYSVDQRAKTTVPITHGKHFLPQLLGTHASSLHNHSDVRAVDTNDLLKPIVRPPFPTQVKDKSPIIGLSANTILRTCFRLGEAINVGRQAVRTGRDVVIELYARVVSSSREENSLKQHFVFADLFSERSPELSGVYDLWKGVELWDYDSSRFLQPGAGIRMCRCIARMKRAESKWSLSILNIWEASWDDIAHVKGIICA